ncbi:hypothetical protein AB1N83_013506 [Pleurotus pulmonarius]|nr:hypothetical protein EYR38_003639 [Pleurotus pulmonarius]
MPPKTTRIDPHATPRASRTKKYTPDAREFPALTLSGSSPTQNSAKGDGSGSGRADSIVFKALLAKLPCVPKMQSFADSGNSTNSRTPTKAELDLKECERLEKVVPCPDIMKNLVKKLRGSLTARRQPTQDDPFMSRLTVENRCAHLPGSICSEHDTEDWVHNAILRPAVAVLQYLLYNNTKTEDFPNISSVGGSAPIPDSVLFKLSRIADNAILTIEFKTHAVLSAEWLDAINVLLASAKGSDTPGSAARFHWPEFEDTKSDKTTSILLQVWGQMRKWRVKYAILSSYRHTYFFFKPNVQSDTLYITDGFESDDEDLLPSTVSWLALALGIYPFDDLELPEPNTQHWDFASMTRFESTGLNPRTYPPSPQAANANRRR